MKVANRITSSRTVRMGVALVGVLGAGISVVVAFSRGGPIVGAVVAGAFAMILVLGKALLEVASEIRREAGQNHEGRLRVVEKSVLDRVRVVEKSVGDQVGFNDAVLDRVRVVEKSVGFNDAVLDRVRAVEKSVGDQVGFNEAVLGRVRAVESRSPPFGDVPLGRTRRLMRTRELVATALTAVAEAGVGAELESAEPVENGGPAKASSTNGSPKVTVVVPCYNEESFVAAALESVQRQSIADWECIVVDDGSSDRSLTDIDHFVAQDDRFRLVRHEVNRGVSAARNTGLELAGGRLVVFHDADDLMMTNSLLDRVAAMEQATDPDVAGVYSGVRVADEGVRLEDLPESERWRPRSAFADFVSSEGECPFGPSAAMLRTAVVRDHDGFVEGKALAEDWDLWLRIMRSGFYFVPSQLRTVIYRQSGGSTAQARAAAHVEASNRLIELAYGASSTGLQPGASYPFPKGLSHYESLLTRSRRAIQYAATTLLRADPQAFESIIQTLEQGSWPLIRRHIDFDTVATDGFRRAAGFDVSDLPDIDSELEPLRAVVRTSVQRVSG